MKLTQDNNSISTNKKYEDLTNNLDIGIFRVDISKKARFLEANPAAVKIFGFNSKEDLFSAAITDLFQTREERKHFYKDLLENGQVKNRVFLLQKKQGTASILSLSANLVLNEKGAPVFSDGVVEDITKLKQLEKERDELIKNLQTTLLLSDHPIPKIEKDIQAASSIEDICVIRNRFPLIIKTLIESKADAEYITRLNSSLSDEIIKSLVNVAIKELGPPPAKFAFIVMGSEGRSSQTLKTDQDNAIIYENVDEHKDKEVNLYFYNLGEKVCNWLDVAGYPFCKGNMMAKNHEWCKPLSVWKKYFKNWIITAEPETLIKTKIFFDFRSVCGDANLCKALKDSLFNDLQNKSPFFWQLAKTMLLFRPPLNIFGNIMLESDGEHKEKFSMKKALTPIIDIARIYALKNHIYETNTFKRLALLFEKGILNKTDYQDILHVFKYLMYLRLKYQAEAVANNDLPDNYLNPKLIPKLDRAMLKEAFSIIESFQTKMSFDFTGRTNPNLI
jgi:PAS domain S-box-containing protein